MGPGSTVVRASYQEIVSTGNTPELQDEIRVYPNPARTELSVEFRLEDLSEITVSLVDLTGRPVGDVYRRSGIASGKSPGGSVGGRRGAGDVFSEASDEGQGACRNDHDPGIVMIQE
jgi:hypothetical protein